ncbi:MAG: AraC family transcriptional regulator [Bacteroidia bacterium]|nr:AraC family transcriptional regulator [Bacteroidia bacterium]
MQAHFPRYTIGHFINQPENPTLFEIIPFAEMEEPEVEAVHKHTFYEILWIDQGRSTQTIDYTPYDIGPGSLFFISPHQLHQFEAWHGLQGGSIFFTEAFFLLHHPNPETLFEMAFLDNLYIQPFIQPDPATYAEIRHTISLLLAEKRRTDPSPTILHALLHIVLARIQRYIQAQAPVVPAPKHLVLYKQFQQEVESHFAAGLSPRDYAARLHVTPHHLNRVISMITGKTTGELIRSRSMLEARRLLTFTDYPVSEIAAGLGYLDLSYFARVFRAETGQAPLAFRQAMSDKYRKPPHSL